jgi:hypothetical protein
MSISAISPSTVACSVTALLQTLSAHGTATLMLFARRVAGQIPQVGNIIISASRIFLDCEVDQAYRVG